MDNLRNYNNSIDYFKGTLIISVFLGHLIIGDIDNTFIRYFIYSFHMPLFIGISGYLFNYNSLNNSPKKFIEKLFKKIIVPYIIAVIFYCSFINLKFILNYDVYSFVVNFSKNVIYSYYHLWYIQGYVSYIIISYFLLKLNIKMNKIIILSVIFSLFVYYLYFMVKIENPFVKIFLNNFRLYNLIFFVIGYCIKEKRLILNLNKRNYVVFLLLFTLNSILGFYTKNLYFVELFFYLSNIFSIIFLIRLCEEYSKFKVGYINFMGKHSLYFYLWHILPIIILKSKILDKNIFLYYLLGVISFYILYGILNKTFSKKGD